MKHIFERPFEGFHVAVATPRSLPPASRLNGRVVVLDLAFAHGKAVGSYPSITHKLIAQLGDRLALFLDHHDSDFHQDFDGRERFILATKAEHGACPEMISPELVARTGPVQTIVCHGDFDGLMSAAKWILGGEEPYEGADRDAWCIDTRMGDPSEVAQKIDRALRADMKSARIKELTLRLLIHRLNDQEAWSIIDQAGEKIRLLEEEAERLALGFQDLTERVTYLDARINEGEYERTHLLLLGQKRAQVAVLHTQDSVTFAAPFNSGVNFLKLFALSGGMPTVVSLPPRRLRGALVQLGVPSKVASSIASSVI